MPQKPARIIAAEVLRFRRAYRAIALVGRGKNDPDSSNRLRIPMPYRLLHRLRRRASTGTARIEVCPPAMLMPREPLWWRIARWLQRPSALHVGVPVEQGIRRLPQVREDFADSLIDIRTYEADELRFAINRARSMRELWHLRSATFRLVALHHSEHEATRRVGHLSRHFPTRSPRSRFG